MDFASLLKIPKRRVPGYTHSILLPNEAKIYAISHSTQTAPSRTADILIFDEAAVVSDAVFSVTLPFVARTGGAVWMLSTPRGQLGFFYNFWHDKDPQWTRIFSTVEDCPEIPKEFVELHRKGAPHLFRQEFYCEFTPAPGSLISRDRLQKMFDPTLNERKLPPLPTRRTWAAPPRSRDLKTPSSQASQRSLTTPYPGPGKPTNPGGTRRVPPDADLP
jgi:hypothetical protein